MEIGKLKPNEYNPNELSPELYSLLLKDIRENGVRYPILVRPDGEDSFEIIDGEHRYRICKRLGWKEIPVKIEKNVTKEEAEGINVRQNKLRGNMSAVKLTRLLKKNQERGLTHREIANKFNMNQWEVSNLLGVEKAILEDLEKKTKVDKRIKPEAVIEDLFLEDDDYPGNQRVTKKHLRVLGRVKDPEKQIEAYEWMVEEWHKKEFPSTRDLEKKIEEVKIRKEETPREEEEIEKPPLFLRIELKTKDDYDFRPCWRTHQTHEIGFKDYPNLNKVLNWLNENIHDIQTIQSKLFEKMEVA